MKLVKPVILTLLVVGMTSLFSGILVAQDTLVKKPRNVIKVKVETDKDGESVTIDTVFTIDEDFNMEAFEEAMKEYEVQMKDMGKYLKEMEIELEGEEMEKAMHMGNMHYFGRPEHCFETMRVSPPKRGESLADVLGDIPMSAVTSYKIKETKNGKRITIEIDEDALQDYNEDVIIWTGNIPPPPPPPRMKKDIIFKKNIEKEEDTE
ncbi:MAG: hypothetical protein IH596_08445 [Bacteroidales bacterium]|nr:hypothetical protein [Bacteroidales bacterium]